MTSGLRIVGLLALVGCGDRHAEPPRKKSPLEASIAGELSARFGVQVSANCAVMIGMTARCEAQLSDGTKLPIAVNSEKREWAWRVDGIVIEQAALTEFVDAALAEVRVEQKVDCRPAVHVVQPGARTTCKLSGGGLAFVEVSADGAARLELELDAAAAAARGELVTPERDRELVTISKDLEGRAGETDGEEEVTGDGGVGLSTDGGV